MPARRRFSVAGGGLVETLYPMDGALDDRIAALHTEAHPVDATIGQRVNHRVRERAWVDLDGNVGGRQDKEGMPDRPDQIRKGFGRQDGRRSAAKVDVVDLDAPFDLSRYQVYFATQGRRVYGNGLIPTNNRGVAAAIPAHRPAERNVKIE
jgi:hypothetical protein